MGESEIKALICEIFLSGDTSLSIGSETALLENGICDSMGFVQIAAAIEQHCPEVQIRDQEITKEHFGTIAAIARFVMEKQQGQ